MLDTETLAVRGGGAVQHGARLSLVSSVLLAMRFFRRCQTRGTACKLALSIRSMLAAETVYFSKSGAAFYLAHFRPTITVFKTLSPKIDGRGAPFPRADCFATMRSAKTTSNSTSMASISRAEPFSTMLPAKSFATCVAAAT